MSLATAGSDGRPLVRTVLLKGLDRRGFVFFTNLERRKARQIGENPNVSILFPWLLREREVVITGCATKIPLAESVEYFVSRPRGSQLAAWASRQSSIISSRKVLEMEWERLKQEFGTGQIPLLWFWGGYRVSPQTIEFWQAVTTACTIASSISDSRMIHGRLSVWLPNEECRDGGDSETAKGRSGEEGDGP